ncbi:hypothetical protein ACFQ6H_14545 [Rhodococcus sp. NPDC056506]|uniref:hypothetical protein n=1 Tax=Rhodococcus sp. NPDC056506 TaxID=3345844 RepID=UPI00367117C1
MTSWTRPSPSPSDAARLNELASGLTASRDAFYRLAEEHKWVPIPGSAAEADAHALNGRTPTAVEEGRLAEFQLISEAVATFLELGVHNCGALAALLQAGEVYGPPYGALRSVIEDCAYTLWILDPELSAADRLARAYVHNLRSAEDANIAASRLGERTLAKPRKTALTSIRADAVEAFPSTTKEEIERKVVAGHAYPEKLVEFTEKLFKLAEDSASGTMSQRQANGLYAYLSNGTHPTLYVLRDMRELYEEGGATRSKLVMDIAFLEKFTRLATIGLLFTLESVCNYFGWPTSDVDGLAKAITDAFPDALEL